MPLFRAKFASNSAFRNPIFRWESCKGSVWESVKKSLKVCKSVGLRLAHGWQVAKGCTQVKHAEELKSHASCCTTGQKSQASKAISSGLELATLSSRKPTDLHTSELFFTLSHTLPLHDSHLNVGFLNAELQANLTRNKDNKIVD